MTLAEDIAQSRILLDTNVVSYLFRRDTRADFFQRFLEGRFLFVSFMTVAELFFGAYRNRWGAARLGRLETHLLRYTLLPLDYRLTQEWARVRAENQAKGRNIEHADAWIAATARLHNCALVTNNARHFSGTAREIGDWSGAAFDPAFPLVLRLA